MINLLVKYFSGVRTMDINNLSVDEMLKLQRQLESAIPRKKAAGLSAFVAEIKGLVAQRGYTLDEVRAALDKTPATTGEKKTRAPAAVKYKLDEERTWTGRGQQPKWLVKYLADGGMLEKLATE